MQNAFYFLGFFIASIFVLYIGQAILLPLVIAIFLWFLIVSVKEGYQKLLRLPSVLANIAAVTSIILIGWFPIQIIKDMIPQVIEAAPTYQDNLFSIWSSLKSQYSFLDKVSFEQLQAKINLGDYLSLVGGGLAQFAGNFFLIALYVVFLLLEQGSFTAKFQKIFSSGGKEAQIEKLLEDMFQKIKQYVWMKSFLSFLTASLSYIVMLYVGLDYAAFWAMLIFFFNYIPNIGSILGTVLPSVLAIIQFQFTSAFFIVFTGIVLIQFIIGNVLEPRIMGKSLNLSPFVIILSLILWGSIWGIIGAFLAVPLMVIVMIILAQFKDTQFIAILMSQDGKV